MQNDVIFQRELHQRRITKKDTAKNLQNQGRPSFQINIQFTKFIPNFILSNNKILNRHVTFLNRHNPVQKRINKYNAFDSLLLHFFLHMSEINYS